MNVADKPNPDPRWYVNVAGAFTSDPVFAEVVRLGREYRESLQPKPKGSSARTRNPTQENRMATVAELEKRVTALETEIAALKKRVAEETNSRPWTELLGKYENDPLHEEAVRVGREYREEVNRKSLEEFDREEAELKAAAKKAKKRRKAG